MSKYTFDSSESLHHLLSSDSSIDKYNNIDISKIKFHKIWQILIGAFILNFIFALLSYNLLYGEISNAVNLIDFFYFGMVSLSTAGYGDMAPITTKAKLCVSMYLLFIFSFMLSFTL